MEVQKDNFYREFRDSNRAFYDWLNHVINLGCSSSDIDFSNAQSAITNAGKDYFVKFVHEYIHFLQNFATPWGVGILSELIWAYLKIGASSAYSNEKILLPLSMDSTCNPLLKEGLSQYLYTISKVTSFDQLLIENGNKGRTINLTFEDNIPVFSTIYFKWKFGCKSIREHMAFLGSELYQAKTDHQIHNDNERFSGFKCEDEPFSDAPQYWVFFEYVYQNYSLTNIAIGLFYLMEICLISREPDAVFLRFLRWFIRTDEKLIIKQDFFTIIEKWLIETNESSTLQKESIIVKQRILKIIKYLEENSTIYPDFCRISKSILDFGLKNVTKQAQKDFTLFRRADQLSDIFHWRWIIQNYGTGLIKYLDETTIHGNPEHIANMKDNFGYVLSLSLVIDRLMHDRLSCPFLDEIPICTSNLKNDTCLKNPFLIKTDFSGKECLYRCGFMLTGMSERIDFNS
jgi:hypothetical protein